MLQSHSAPKVLVALLVPAAFLVRTAALMLGPLLVALAAVVAACEIGAKVQGLGAVRPHVAGA